MTAGYSGTPLAKKLGIMPGASIMPIGAPDAYLEWVSPLPEGVRTVPKGPADLVHLFVTSRAALEAALPQVRAAIPPDGAIWVSWYKKTAKIPTDVTEDVIRDMALRGDLVDVKVCAVTDQWSGLKLVVRKALR